jgi:hypothetical protein
MSGPVVCLAPCSLPTVLSMFSGSITPRQGTAEIISDHRVVVGSADSEIHQDIVRPSVRSAGSEGLSTNAVFAGSRVNYISPSI